MGGSNSSWLSSGLVGYWKMDETSWGTVADSSGNGNNGTATNGATVGVGKYGNSGSFDGTNDYVSVTNTSALNPSTITIETWFKGSAINGTNANQRAI